MNEMNWLAVYPSLVLLVMALLQIRYGLSPLRRVRAAIQNLRTTGANRITEPLPLEVHPRDLWQPVERTGTDDGHGGFWRRQAPVPVSAPLPLVPRGQGRLLGRPRI